MNGTLTDHRMIRETWNCFRNSFESLPFLFPNWVIQLKIIDPTNLEIENKIFYPPKSYI